MDCCLYYEGMIAFNWLDTAAAAAAAADDDDDDDVIIIITGAFKLA